MVRWVNTGLGNVTTGQVKSPPHNGWKYRVGRPTRGPYHNRQYLGNTRDSRGMMLNLRRMILRVGLSRLEGIDTAA